MGELHFSASTLQKHPAILRRERCKGITRGWGPSTAGERGRQPCTSSGHGGREGRGVKGPHQQTSPRPGPLLLPPHLSGPSAPPAVCMRPLLPMRAPTRALSRWKQRGATAFPAWPAATRGGRCRAASRGPREPPAPRGPRSSSPRSAAASHCHSALLRPPPPSTEARRCDRSGGRHGGAAAEDVGRHGGAAAAEDGGQPGPPASSSLLVSQSDMAAPRLGLRGPCGGPQPAFG